MTDLQTKNTSVTEMQGNMAFVVNEFQRVRIPPKARTEEKEFQHMANAQKQKLMERLIDRVKDI
jgi:hypothetical protein